MRLGLSTAAFAALLIAGCDQPGNSAGNGIGNATNGTASAPTGNMATLPPIGNDTSLGGNSAQSAPAGGGAGSTALTRDYVVGRWSVTGNCTTPEFVFNADGTVSRGGRSYQWRVDGGNLVVTRQGETRSESTPVRVVDQRNMVVTAGEGPIPLSRC